ncbi:MAG: hypothetical protein M3252_05960 [Actinomycetota bacterium]|nr:hypothetical protein [Actinomycetota bacterium]
MRILWYPLGIQSLSALSLDLEVEANPYRGGVTRLDVEKLAQRVGFTADTVRDLLARFGPVQLWVLERLMADADTDPWPPWVALSELAAEHAGGRAARRDVESMRRACARLARAELLEISRRWIEREEERMALPWLRRETTIKRRHLCVRLPLDADQRERWAASQGEHQGRRRARSRNDPAG